MEIDSLSNHVDADLFYPISPSPIEETMIGFIPASHVFDSIKYLNPQSSELFSIEYQPKTKESYRSSNSIENIQAKIQGFINLKEGWYFKKGESFDKRTIQKAISFLKDLDFEKIDAFPGKNGQVTISIYSYNNCDSFTFKHDDFIDYFSSDDERVLIYQPNIKIEDAELIINELKCKTILDLWIRSATVTRQEDALPKTSSLTTEELQLSRTNASSTALNRFASF